MADVISRVYSDAVFALALEQGEPERWSREADWLRTVLKENRELVQVMAHPGISGEKKRQILSGIFAGNISKEMAGLLDAVVRKGHISHMEEILECLSERIAEYRAAGAATVYTARELNAGQRKRIEQRLLETTGYAALQVEYRVDDALIGGIVIRVRDRVIDGSVRGRLERLTDQLSRIQ